jgi:hypothetical protein
MTGLEIALPAVLQYNPCSSRLIIHSAFQRYRARKEESKLRLLKTVFLLFFAFGTVISFSKLNYSKPADAKKTGKSCTYCHTKYGSKDLTDAGKCYKDKGTLDGCKE